MQLLLDANVYIVDDDASVREALSWMLRMRGLELFTRLRAQGLLATFPVIFLTGHVDVPTAVDSVKRGAFDFCEKPFSNTALVDRIEAALAKSHAAVIESKARRQIGVFEKLGVKSAVELTNLLRRISEHA